MTALNLDVLNSIRMQFSRSHATRLLEYFLLHDNKTIRKLGNHIYPQQILGPCLSQAVIILDSAYFLQVAQEDSQLVQSKPVSTDVSNAVTILRLKSGWNDGYHRANAKTYDEKIGKPVNVPEILDSGWHFNAAP